MKSKKKPQGWLSQQIRMWPTETPCVILSGITILHCHRYGIENITVGSYDFIPFIYDSISMFPGSMQALLSVVYVRIMEDSYVCPYTENHSNESWNGFFEFLRWVVFYCGRTLHISTCRFYVSISRFMLLLYLRTSLLL